MFRHFARVAAIAALSGAVLIGVVSAQTARRTLSQRLEQFRDDLIGDGSADDGSQDTGLPATPPKAVGGGDGSRAAAPQGPRLATRPAGPTVADDDAMPSSPESSSNSRADGASPTPASIKLPTASGASPTPAASKTGKPRGSSRRTAQPDYKPSAADAEVAGPPATEPTPAKRKSGPTLAKPPKNEPTLAKGPKSEPTLATPNRSSADPTTSSPELMREQRLTNETESTGAAKRTVNAPARLARGAQPSIAPPARPNATDTDPAKSKLHKGFEQSGKGSRETDVLFSTQSPLLTVEAAGPHKVLVGKPAVFTVKLRNTGEVAANQVVVSINIPPYAEVLEAQPTAGTTHSPTGTEHHEPLEWKLPRFEAHGHETLTLKIVPRKSIPLDLAVHWTCAPEVSQTLVEVQEPKLAMTLSGPGEVHYGQTKIYKLTISNPGNGDTENVVVNLLPIGRAAEGTASHKLGLLRAGESKAIEVELTARQAGALIIRAQAYADGGLRADASEPVLVRRGALQIDVEGPKVKYAGTTATYRLHLTNPGDATAENVHVSALLPPGAKYVGSNAGGRDEADRGKVTWHAGNLQAGGERTLEVQCNLLTPGDNRIQAMAAGDGELAASGAANTRVDALADLKLEVRDPQGPIPLGEDAVYEVVIRNRGTKSAEKIDLVVFFSEGLEATAVQGGPHEIGHGQVFFKTIPTLAAGSETVFRVHARADRPANHVFRAEVVCESLQTKLAAEETTRFYGEEASEPVSAGPGNEPDLQPIPKE